MHGLCVLMTSRPVALWNAHLGPWRVRKCPSDGPCLALVERTYITFYLSSKGFDRGFCSIQLTSSNGVPVVLSGAQGS